MPLISVGAGMGDVCAGVGAGSGADGSLALPLPSVAVWSGDRLGLSAGGIW